MPNNCSFVAVEAQHAHAAIQAFSTCSCCLPRSYPSLAPAAVSSSVHRARRDPRRTAASNMQRWRYTHLKPVVVTNSPPRKASKGSLQLPVTRAYACREFPSKIPSFPYVPYRSPPSREISTCLSCLPIRACPADSLLGPLSCLVGTCL